MPCVGVDSSRAQFSILDSYELDSTQAKSVTSVRGQKASKMHFRGGRNQCSGFYIGSYSRRL